MKPAYNIIVFPLFIKTAKNPIILDKALIYYTKKDMQFPFVAYFIVSTLLSLDGANFYGNNSNNNIQFRYSIDNSYLHSTCIIRHICIWRFLRRFPNKESDMIPSGLIP